jgi:formylglycine-generating enzyme
MIGPTQPDGPGSSIEGKANYPEMHVGFEDGLDYAQWARRAPGDGR